MKSTGLGLFNLLITRLRTLIERKYNYLMIIILVLGFLLRIGFISRAIGRDEAAFLYYGWMIVKGKVLYRDLFNQKAPGVYFTVALIFLLVGKQILLVRIVSMFLSTITAFVVFKIGYKINNPLTGIISALFFILEPVTLRRSTMVFSETFMVFFMALAVYFYILAHKKNNSWYYLIVGVLIGLSTIMRQTGIILAFVIILHRLYVRHPLKNLLQSMGVLIAGFLMSIIPIVVYFIAVNALNDAIYSIFFFNLSPSYGFTLLRRVDNILDVFLKDPILWCIGLGGLLLIIERRKEWHIFLAGWFIASFILVISLSTPYGHYYIQIMPAFSLLGGILVERLLVISEELVDSASQSLLYPNIINWLLVVLLLIGIGTIGLELYFDMKTSHGLPYQIEAAEYVKTHTAPDEIIFSPDSAYYLLTDRQNKYRIEHLAAGHIEAFGISDLPQYLEEEQVRYIIIDYNIEIWNFNEEHYRTTFNDETRAEEVKIVYEWILNNYEIEATFGSGTDMVKIYRSSFW
ncbi:glycosyltransferase family 39 protein [Candidatus Borrarchaeum sp.]|uniref:ArnT family glycosyltransferase n=1 Tax=Candidatus Borrarchaeum sp. TaxID=2846742 RepID=UPI00257B00C4|nr:glycosyltransferase family 39 protein [Candidatus Borrarchaeum sp.]